ncbi:MAG TPA: class II aldolase/adducin family protein [bacterium]|nr:class II aldolase/adducin family protein [bacterium]
MPANRVPESEGKLVAEIIRYGRLLVSRGLVTGTGGNISARVPEQDAFLITPSGIPYYKIQPDDIVMVSLSGRKLAGKRKPSIEQHLHRLIYRARADVKAIMHTHAVFSTTIAATRQDFPPVLDTFVAAFGGGIKTAEYASIGTIALAQNAVKALGLRSGVLLANHGAVCTGEDLAQAFDRAEFLEASAKTYVFSHLIGQPVVLPLEIVEQEAKDLAQRYGQK